MTLRIDYTNMMGDVVDGRHRRRRLDVGAATRFKTRARRLGNDARGGRARIPRPARRRRAASSSRTDFAAGDARQVRRRRRARHRRLGARADRAAHGAARPPLEHARRRGARRLPAAARARQRRSANDRRAARPPRSRAVAVRRHVEVRRHRRDDGAVSHRARRGSTRRRRRARTSIWSSSPIRRRARCAPIARSERIRGARHSAERRRTVQRAHAGRHAAGGARSGSTRRELLAGAADMRSAAHRRRPREEPGRRLRDAAVPRRHEATAGTSTCSCRTPIRCATSPTGSCSSGPRASASIATAGDAGVGPTPLAALGATDQHSKVQLFMEGPADKTVTFIAVDESAEPTSRSRRCTPT